MIPAIVLVGSLLVFLLAGQVTKWRRSIEWTRRELELSKKENDDMTHGWNIQPEEIKKIKWDSITLCVFVCDYSILFYLLSLASNIYLSLSLSLTLSLSHTHLFS